MKVLIANLIRSIDVAGIDIGGEDVVMLPDFFVTNRLRPDERETRGSRVNPGVEAVGGRDLDGEALGVASGVGTAVGLFWKK